MQDSNKSKKTLYEHIRTFTLDSGFESSLLYPHHVKVALKEFIDWCETRALEIEKGKHNYGYRGKAKEIFGVDLIE